MWVTSDEFKMDFCRRFSDEMKRHRQEGTLRQSDYKEKDWDKIQLLLTDPQGYSYLYLNNAALMKAAEKIWNSNSYKLGYALTNPVRSVKKKLHRKK